MKHFTLTELTRSATATRMGIDNTPDAKATQNLTLLVNLVLDPLREAWGSPLTVNSGYRCAALNRAVGGAAHSQHLTGQAADITTGNRDGNKRLYALLKRMSIPVDQAINEHDYSWIHISYSPTPRHHFFSIP